MLEASWKVLNASDQLFPFPDLSTLPSTYQIIPKVISKLKMIMIKMSIKKNSFKEFFFKFNLPPPF
jgi:hypothetical protein